MSANVALTDTFDTWRTRTNSLLMYTQAGTGGVEAIEIANTTDASSNTTGSFQTTGGGSFAKTVYIGENFYVQGNTTFSKDVTINQNTIIGSADSDVVTVNARLASNVVPNADGTINLGNTTVRYATAFVNGVVGSNTVASLQIPAGTTAQRGGETGSIRYNSTLSRFEGNTGTNFVHLGNNLSDQDGDTKITIENSADEDHIRFFTGNSESSATERVNISQGGNVAIGTAAVLGDATLQVSGTANVSGVVTLANVLDAKGNVKASGAFVNAQTTSYITLKSPITTIDSNTTTITGNLVVQGSRTYLDTDSTVNQDKTLVLGAGSNVRIDATFTAANPTTVTVASGVHGLTSADKVLVLRSSDTTNIPEEALYTVTVSNTTVFTIPISGTPSGTGTLDFVGPQLDTTIDEAGLVIAGNTVHKLVWDDADDGWNATDNFIIAGDLTVEGNDIKSSTATALTLTGANVEVAGDLTITGNDIKSSGATAITLSGANVEIAGDLQVTGNDIKASDGTATQTFNGANVSFPGRITFASGAAANTILVGDSSGLLTHAAFGIYNSSGTRIGP